MLYKFLVIFLISFMSLPQYSIAEQSVRSIQIEVQASETEIPVKPKKIKKSKALKKPQYGSYDGYFYLGLLLIIANLIFLAALILMMLFGVISLGFAFWIYIALSILGLACGIYIIVYFFT